jgi:epoxyqueuosine reductase
LANSVQLSQSIKAEAHRLGFLLCGITTPAPPEHYGTFLDWLSKGRHSGMGYLASERSRLRRGDPLLILPEARSVICLGLPYSPAESVPDLIYPDLNPPEPAGKVASYAWGADYHEVIPPLLEQLAAFLQRLAGQPVLWKAYTDTGPLLERDLAQRAGLGWIGKNTNLIHPQHGSYFLLSELLVDVILEPDPPFPTDHCGSCTRCIDACPTDCILPDRTIDARRCISYLTIEHKGAIPPDLRSRMNEWVFGCDVCQTVCPWNIRFASHSAGPGMEPQPSISTPALGAELQLTPAQFNRKFRGSPIQRPHRRGYLRNVAVALGNTADPSAVPVLAQTLFQEPETVVRGHAAWALGQIGGPEAREALENAYAQETEPSVREEISAAIKILRRGAGSAEPII